MKKHFYRSGLAVLAAAVLFSGCDPEIDAPEISKGDADFTRYVSLGNSLTAGFADAALYRAGQEVSYPSILAQQFKLAGGGEFKQPLITVGTAGDIGIGSSGNPRLVLANIPDCKGVISPSPIPAEPLGNGDITIFTNLIGSQGPFNNLGVPGAKSFHLLAPGYGNPNGLFTTPRTANPFFVRFASGANATIIQDAAAQNPTFFTLWIGNNDILGYGLEGGDGSETITSEAMFKGSIDAVINTLVANGAKGAIGNIPDLTKAPYFTTVPYNGLVLQRQGQADSLKAAYGGAINFTTGPNPFIVKENGTIRPLNPGELILLPASNQIKCSGLGSKVPIPDNLVLSAAEIDSIRKAVAVFNTKLKEVADSKGLAYMDAFSVLNSLATGLIQNQVTYSTTFASGNIFSLDGLHFAPRGNALVANEFIKAINAKYNASIPTVNVNDYNGVLFP